MITITKYLSTNNINNNVAVDFTIYLTSEQRQRTQQRIELDDGESLYLRLPRGKTMNHGDILQSENGEITVKVVAKSESVITVTAPNPLTLMKAAYHLGNRHVPLEITNNYLKFSPDKILEKMLTKMGLNIKKEMTPFYPEIGAYHHHN